MTDKFAMADMTAGELNALVKNLGGAEAARRVNRGELTVAEAEKSGLLRQLASGIIVPGAERFNVVEAFAEGEHADGVHIFGVNETFREHFFGKTEEDVPEVTVAAYELTKGSRDPAIITALGGEERAEFKLAHVRELMRRTQAGEESSLQRGVNVLYARDGDDTLFAVNAYWRADARVWNVSAYSVEGPRPWFRGFRVLSSNC